MASHVRNNPDQPIDPGYNRNYSPGEDPAVIRRDEGLECCKDCGKWKRRDRMKLGCDDYWWCRRCNDLE